jgi:hypothetical protein
MYRTFTLFASIAASTGSMANDGSITTPSPPSASATR